MKRSPLKSFRNSDLDRAKPRKRIFHSFINKNLKQPKKHHSDTGLVEDRTSSTTIVRIIAGLLMVHVVVIGGALMHGKITKNKTGLAVTPGITPPPTAPAAPAAPAQPGPVNMTAVLTPQATPAPAPAAPAANPTQVHITQNTAPAQQATPAVQPTPAPVKPAGTTNISHRVCSGDTWQSVAVSHGITVEELKAANPTISGNANLFTGYNLVVPVPLDSEAGKAAAVAQQQEEAAKPSEFYVVQSGDTLNKISKKVNVPLEKIYSLNNLTPKDARRIRTGMKLRVRE